MVGVIIGARWLGINPDNVAIPMAASFGDLITLALLACFSQWSYSIIGKKRWGLQDALVGLVISTFDQQVVLVTIPYIKLKKLTYAVLDWILVENKDIMTFSLDRFVSLCIISGGSAIFVPDSSLGGYRFQTSSQSHSAPHRLGANHYSNGHQQVLTSVL